MSPQPLGCDFMTEFFAQAEACGYKLQLRHSFPGERENILKYRKKFPPPRGGRDRVGAKMGFFHTFGEAGGGIESLPGSGIMSIKWGEHGR